MTSSFTDNDKQFLVKNLLSRYDKPIVCAEVGNMTGNSTRFFSTHIPNDSVFYSIDIRDHDIEVPDNVTRVKSCSLEWDCPESLDFVYLDGNHDTSHVIKEIDKYLRVTDTVSGHDCGHVAYALYRQFGNKDRHTELLLDNQCSSWIMRVI